ncbi:MFS transporter [Nakamurella endophytica]|uniref:MFS transporter n=1 Tax=Nakamurella endophytica TaxID=1748367 RepID=A0A917SPG3_9ACTN|nr:MFS transporter [Nakamurella endophytica]GGL91071.1 MFS transporter [Nakamurella endophytica]
MNYFPTAPRAQRASVALQFFAMGTTTGSWAARIPTVRAQIGLSDAQWGLAALASTAGSLISLLTVMYLVGRVGPRRMACAGVLLLLLNAPLLAGSTHPAALVQGLLVQGLATGLLAPSMNAQAVEVERSYGRRIMSSFHACFSVGQLAGGVFGALAAGAGMSPRAQLVVSSAVLLVLLLAGYRTLPADPPRVAGGRRREARRVTPQLALLAVIALLASVNEGAAVQWSAQYTSGYLAAGASVGAVTFTTFSVAMAVARTVGDRLLNRLGPSRFVLLSELVVASGMAVGLATGTVWGALLGFAALGIGSACVVPTLMGLAGQQPGIPTAVGVSVVSLGQWPAILLGPPLVGGIAGLVGLRAALYALVVAAVVIVLLTRRMRVPSRDEHTVASRALADRGAAEPA